MCKYPWNNIELCLYYIFKTFFTFEEIASKGFRLLEGMLHMLLARLRIFNFVSSLKFLSFNWLVFILKILGFSSCNIQLFLESTEQHLIIFSRTLLFSTALTYNSKNSRLCRSIYCKRYFTVKKSVT